MPQVYKLVLAARLADAGQCERALQYTERAARALAAAPRRSAALAAAVAQLADRYACCFNYDTRFSFLVSCGYYRAHWRVTSHKLQCHR